MSSTLALFARCFSPFALTLALLLCIGVFASAQGCRPLGADKPSRVESGLPYRSGQPDFDGFFAEYHSVNQELAKAPDEERSLRREFAKKLEVTAGATPQFLVETVRQRAQELAAKKISIQLQVEGYGAEDDADTLVQSSVSGTLDDPSRSFVENTTLCARQELKHAAKLRKAKKQLLKLTVQELALEPSIEGYFEAQGYAKTEEVRRNLLAAKRSLPLLSQKASDDADESELLVKKLAAALTTDPELSRKTTEPSLITNVEQTPTRKRGRAVPSGPRKPGATAAPKPKSEATEADSGDFAP